MSLTNRPKRTAFVRGGSMLRRGAPKLDENGKPMRDARGKVSMSRTASRLSTPSTSKKHEIQPLRIHPVRERRPQIGQCHHCQHQRRRREIFLGFLVQG